MKKVIILGALLVIIGGIVWFGRGSSENSLGGSQTAKYAEPADAVDGFYGDWLKAAKDPSATPDKATLAKSETLTKELRDKVAAGMGAALDPVLCQTTVPQDIVIRNVYEQTDVAQLLVTSKDKAVTKQAVVSLIKSDNSWFINEIQCTDGDVAPVTEFNFDKEGFLIKNSVPKPFNNKNWHIVFIQDGKAGNVAPLIFDAKSMCTNLEGVKAVCKPDQFTEASKVRVRGGMSERGATVVTLEFVK